MAMMTPPKINNGTAKIGVELAPEKVLFNSCTIEPPLSIKKIGAAEPKIMLTAMGMDNTMATRNTPNTKRAAIIHRPLFTLKVSALASSIACSAVFNSFS